LSEEIYDKRLSHSPSAIDISYKALPCYWHIEKIMMMIIIIIIIITANRPDIIIKNKKRKHAH